MAYYPMSVFFEQSPLLSTVAEVLFREFAVDFQEFGVAHSDAEASLPRDFKQADQALAHVKEVNLPIIELWCAADYHQIIVRKTANGYIDIEFLDFDSEIYDKDGPSEDLQQEKRALAIKLHSVLIEKCGALLCYTLAADNSDAADDFLDKSNNVNEILRLGDFQLLEDCFRNKLYVWLVGIRIDSNIYKSVSEILSLYFRKANGSVFEHRENRPYFMN